MIVHNSMFSLKFLFSEHGESVFSKELLIGQRTDQVKIAHGGNQGTAMLVDE